MLICFYFFAAMMLSPIAMPFAISSDISLYYICSSLAMITIASPCPPSSPASPDVHRDALFTFADFFATYRSCRHTPTDHHGVSPFLIFCCHLFLFIAELPFTLCAMPLSAAA